MNVLYDIAYRIKVDRSSSMYGNLVYPEYKLINGRRSSYLTSVLLSLILIVHA